MKDRHITHKGKVFLLLCILLSGVTLFNSSEYAIMLHVLSIVFLAVSACLIVKFDFFHPFCWFSLFYCLYACSYAIMYKLGVTVDYGYSKDGLLYHWIGLTTILLILPIQRHRVINRYHFKSNSNYVNTVLNILLLYLVLAVFSFFFGSFSNKTEIYQNGSFWILLSFKLAYFVILIYIYQLYKILSQTKQTPIWLIVKCSGVIFFFGLSSGERDYIFTILLVTVMILFLFSKIRKSQLFASIPLGIILLPLSRIFKYYALTGNIEDSLDTNHLLIEFLDGEFISAGRNLQILIANHCENFFGGTSLLNDFVRTVVDTGYSNQIWFNEQFFTSLSTQYGFTLVGEGYVNGGIWGIILVYVITGLLLRYLYINASKSSYGFIIYLYMLPLFIYSTRADLANILSPLLKYALLGTLIIMSLEYKGDRRTSIK